MSVTPNLRLWSVISNASSIIYGFAKADTKKKEVLTFYKFEQTVNKYATYEDLMEFYEERCFPRERANCKTVLKSIGLDYYDPELICRKTHGQQFDDFMWIQFSDEPQVEYKDIKLRD